EDLGVRMGLGLHVHARVVQPARQATTRRLTVGKMPRQRGLTTRAPNQQGRDKVTKGFAMMSLCLGPKSVDIVVHASGLRVLCHSKPNSCTSPFSLPLAHLANVSRLQIGTSFCPLPTTVGRRLKRDTRRCDRHGRTGAMWREAS